MSSFEVESEREMWTREVMKGDDRERGCVCSMLLWKQDGVGT